jgi:ubiquinone/menaquinone biosynthesis C-methylase UbiE
MFWHLAMERLARRESPRVPEPAQVMVAQDSTAAFRDAGRDGGVVAFLYLYHALQATGVIRPRDRVLDLACGPANQLALVARLTPRAHFIGLDLSPAMLASARTMVAERGLANVELRAGDMARLEGFEAASIDVVLCTMSLHHLDDAGALSRTAEGIRRVLKPGGAVYMADFGRLRRAATQEYFVNDWRSEQPEAFTRDFRDSMRSAFLERELRAMAARIDSAIEVFATALAPFMVVMRSRRRREFEAQAVLLARELHAQLDAKQQRRFQVFSRWLAAGGCELPVRV